MERRRYRRHGRSDARTASTVAFGLLLCGLAPGAGHAQNSSIVFDGTMGREGALLPDGATYTIAEADGRPVGRNLFHSFSRFDLSSGDTADFTGSPVIENLIIRNTGAMEFAVDGIFRSSLENAQILVVSPAGVITGPDAVINVPRSMFLSGASSLRFSDGETDFVLDATGASPDDPALTSLPPVAFGFGPGAGIVEIKRSNGLAVDPGETLSFTGTQIDGTGSGSTTVGGPGNIVQLGAAVAGELPLDLALLDPAGADAPDMGQIILSSDFTADVSSAGTDVEAGSIVIRGGQFALLGDATLRSRNQVGTDALGAIDIAASESATLTFGAEIISQSDGGGRGSDILLSAPVVDITGAANVLSKATGTSIGGDVVASGGELTVTGTDTLIAVSAEGDAASGHIELSAGRIQVSDRGKIVSDSSASADGVGGDIDLLATESVIISNGAQILSIASGASRGGDLIISDAPVLRVVDGGRLLTEARQDGAGGTLQITADEVHVTKDPTDSRQTEIATASVTGASSSARGGDLIIDSDRVEVTGGGQIGVVTDSAARQGDLRVRADTSVLASGFDDFGRPSGFFSRAESQALPVPGEDAKVLSIDTGDFELRDGAEVSASTFGDAAGADIQLIARNTVRIGHTIGQSGERAPLVSSSSFGKSASGHSGVIQIDADQVELRNGGQVVSDTFGKGDAGQIQITAVDIEIAGRDVFGSESRVSSESKSFADSEGGAAGQIALIADDEIRVADGGVVSVSTSDFGAGGSILLDAGRRVSLAGGAQIRATAAGNAAAGSVTILAGERFESSNSTVVTRALVLGGGQIHIEASRLVELTHSTIDAQVQTGGGDGGDVFIDPEVVVLNNSSIIASAIDGRGGNITIIADQLLRSRGSELIATSATNVAGQIITTAPESQLPSELASIERPFLDASDLMATRCDLRSERSGSFTVALAGGARVAPDQILDARLLHPHDGSATYGVCAPAETHQ